MNLLVVQEVERVFAACACWRSVDAGFTRGFAWFAHTCVQVTKHSRSTIWNATVIFHKRIISTVRSIHISFCPQIYRNQNTDIVLFFVLFCLICGCGFEFQQWARGSEKIYNRNRKKANFPQIMFSYFFDFDLIT